MKKNNSVFSQLYNYIVSNRKNFGFLSVLIPILLSAQWLETTITVGTNPRALVWNSTNNKIYCTNANSGNVTVIDGQTNSVITTLAVGYSPFDLVWNSQNNKIYCANSNSDNVTVINGQTNSVITTITVGSYSYPCALVWNSQNNKVYCANYLSNNVAVIDGQADSVITFITVVSEPYALVWNSQNNKIYCANYGSTDVTVINGQTNSVITNITVGRGPWVCCWNSIQNRVYVANFYSSSVSVIRDVMGIEEHLKLNTPSQMFEVYPNPAKIYFTVRLPKTIDRSQIKIFDVRGNMVKNEELKGKSNRISLDGIKNGIYFVKAGYETRKIVVNK